MLVGAFILLLAAMVSSLLLMSGIHFVTAGLAIASIILCAGAVGRDSRNMATWMGALMIAVGNVAWVLLMWPFH